VPRLKISPEQPYPHPRRPWRGAESHARGDLVWRSADVDL